MKSEEINGYGLLVVPRSWALGVWYKPHKTLWSFGPFRFVFHHGLTEWKSSTSEITTLRAEIERLRAALKLARQYMPMGREIYDDSIQDDVDSVEAALGGKVEDGSKR